MVALIPSKNIEPRNGVSTLAIIKIRKHLLNLEKFDSPYKYIAADVDQSGSISTLDLIQISRHLLNVELLDSPYKRLAADVDGVDAVEGAVWVIQNKLKEYAPLKIGKHKRSRTKHY